MRTLYLILTILCLCRSQKMVSELLSETLESFMNTNKMGFIKFYSPNCRHSQSIEPVYEQSAKLVKEKGYNAVFARIDADKFPDVVNKFDISEVPQILWFNAERGHLVPYVGDTEMPVYFISYIEEQLSYSTPEITFSQWKNMTTHSKFGSVSSSQNVLIIVGNMTNSLETFFKITNAAWNVYVREIFWTNDKEFSSYYNLDNSVKNAKNTSIVAFDLLMFKIRNNRTFIDIYEKVNITTVDLQIAPEIRFSSSSLILENVLRLYSKEIVNIFSHVNERFIILAVPTLVFAHNYNISTPQYDEMIDTLTRVALRYRREIFFMYGSPQTKFTQIFTESYRLFTSQFPVLLMASASETNQNIIEKYKRVLPKDRVATEVDLIQFIEDWKSMSLKPYVSSEEVPPVPFDENGIYKLVGDTFKRTVEAPGKDVFVVFCSDKLDVCNKFKEIYIRVARKLKNNERILFAEVNPYTNELDFHGFDQMPGVVIFPDNANKMKEFKTYKGKLVSRDIIKFIKENVVYNITSELSLPVEDVLSKDEDFNEIKAINLDQKGVARKLYEKVTDPDQRSLYKIPDKIVIQKEKEYLERKMNLAMQKKISLNLKDDL